MKKTMMSLLSLFVLGLLTISCSSQDEMAPNAQDQAEVEFELNLLGNAATTRAENLGTCPELTDLVQRANAGKLKLNVTIGLTNHSLNVIYTGTKFVTEPVILAAGTHSVSQATVFDHITSEVLFSAVGTSSAYATYVPELLPKSITIGNAVGNIPLYEKTAVDLYFVCAVNETPKSFGFVKWNVHFTKVFCIPFAVNKCDATGEDFTAKGTVQVENGTYVNNVFTPVDPTNKNGWAYINTTTNFPANATNLGTICFADNYDLDNTTEYYRITLNITSPTGIAQTIVGYANVETLRKYKESNAWDTTNNMLHLNFCSCKTWFFPSTCTEEPENPETCDDKRILNLTNLTALTGFEDVIQTKGPDEGFFKDGLTSVTLSTSGISFYEGYTIRFKDPLKYYNTTGNVSFVNMNHTLLSQGSEITSPYIVRLYKGGFSGSPVATISCPNDMYYKMFDALRYTTNIPTCLNSMNLISGDCYYYEIEFRKNCSVNSTPIYIQYLTINHGECPTQVTIGQS